MRLARLIGPELEILVREDPDELRKLLDEIHPEDVADIISDLDDKGATRFLTELPTEYAAQVFERLDEDRQEVLASRMSLDSTTRIVSEMDADERVDFVSILPPEVMAPLLARLEKVDPEAAEEVEELSRWPENSAGGLMTTEYIAVTRDLTVHQAIEEVRRQAKEAEAIDAIYVLDQRERLEGFLTLRNLLLSDPARSVAEAMAQNVISVPPDLDQEDVAHKIAKYDMTTLPVVGGAGQLLGVITADDILDVLHEEQAEDVHKMGAVEPIREGYFDASFAEYIRKRAPWLAILFVGGYLTTWAMEAHENVLASLATLSFYVPLLIAAGGNSGSQSATLVIRALAVGEVRGRDWRRVLGRELLQGITLGALLAVLGIFRVALGGDGMSLALLMAVSIVALVIIGCVIGAMMPIILYKLGFDPATSSAPFITTLVDVLGIVTYLGLAQWLLGDMIAAGSH